MGKIIYQNEKIKVKYDTHARIGYGNCYLYYGKYRLPLAIENELTREQAEQLAKTIEPALNRLYFVASADGIHKGEEQGKKNLQNDLKKLLGIEEVKR